MEIYNLKDATKECGGKAFGLAELIEAGVKVPTGYVIKDSEDISESNLEEIQEMIKEIGEGKLLAVRSSASAEDGEKNSFAGVFDTMLNVEGNPSSVIKAVKNVNDSMNTDTAVGYDTKKDAKMNVVVQQMVDSKISGICFTNVVDLDGSKVALIEFVEGLGEKLVSGKANASRIIIKYNEDKLSFDNFRFEGNFQNLTNFDKLIEEINKAISHFEYDLDIEWCIDREGNTYLVQARPITKKVFVNKKINDKSNTIVACNGVVEGETYVIHGDLSYEEIKREIEEMPEGTILVTNYTETYYLPAMKKAKGIITETGSALCHAAIVARELNIPCIIGYDNATEKYPSGSKIKLDATNNRIVSNDKNETISNEYKMDYGSLDCFDNYVTINIDKVRIFVEFTLDSLVVHMPEGIPAEMVNKIDYFVRKRFAQAPIFAADENKYLWIKEVERFRKLPLFNDYYERVKKSAKDFNGEELIAIQAELFEIVKKVVNAKNNTNDKALIFFYDEIMASINEILDGIIPFGYPLYEAYTQSIQLLENENIEFNDLFKTNIELKNQKLETIKKYLSVVSTIKNDSYQKVWDLGGPDPDYFEKRDKAIAEFLKTENIEINDELLNVFYNTYLKEKIETLNEVVTSDNYEKKSVL